ncbi:synaptonemal complex central element protein 2 [Plakobranchus ocellatus]|uniref:Synaptonemal complex central element protein 2 n=1 Tax=Plakobranchus ocellatus TaxID=259542 RepID=A0AAV3Z008_9GAST|nr:synaptonemal complex central element protein 2 [Plakobranchus ocellatus]
MDCEDNEIAQNEELSTDRSENEHFSKETNVVEGNNNEVKDEKYRMTMKDIEASMKQMINEINSKRENDLAILEEVKREIMAQAKRCCEVLEQHMANMHAAKGKEIDDKWENLVKVLDRIKESEAEIEKTKTSLSLLCKDSLDTEP